VLVAQRASTTKSPLAALSIDSEIRRGIEWSLPKRSNENEFRDRQKETGILAYECDSRLGAIRQAAIEHFPSATPVFSLGS